MKSKKEGVTTLPGSLGVNPPQWTTAHKDVPPEWLSQEGHPCSRGGKAGFMRVVDGKLVCVPTPKESIKMDATVLTEGTNLHFASPSRTQIAKAHVYFDVRRRQVGLDNVRVSTIQGVQGNWFFDVSSHENNQFLDPTRLHNILPADVTVTASAPPTPQTASQDEVRNAIREMVEQRFNELIAEKS